jgi:ParB family transcriptional regulator, chromosome partitioning protein
MKIKIDEIKINKKKRIRRDIGNIDELTRSMSKLGLLQPLVVDRNFNLIAGYRRYLAARKLGWKSIEVLAVDAGSKVDRLEIEMDENIIRKDFTYDEIDHAIERRERYNRVSVFRLIADFIGKLFSR